jgi:hypothetical protein
VRSHGDAAEIAFDIGSNVTLARAQNARSQAPRRCSRRARVAIHDERRAGGSRAYTLNALRRTGVVVFGTARGPFIQRTGWARVMLL